MATTHVDMMPKADFDRQLAMLTELIEFDGEPGKFYKELEHLCIEDRVELPQPIKDMLTNPTLFDDRITSTFSDLWSPVCDNSVVIDPKHLATVNEVVADFLAGVISILSNSFSV